MCEKLKTLPKLMGRNHFFSMITAYVFPPWHCVNTHLNAPDQQTAKSLAFIEVITLADNQLLEVFNSYGSSNGVLTYTWLIHFGFIFVK